MWSLLGFKAKWKRGERIEAAHPTGKYLPGIITEVHDNGQYYTIEYEGGEKHPRVSSKFVRNLSVMTTTTATSRITEASFKTSSSLEQDEAAPPAPASGSITSTPSGNTQMRKSISVGKLQKAISGKSIGSEKDGERQKLTTPIQSRRNSTNVRKPSMNALSRKSSNLNDQNSSPDKPQTPAANDPANHLFHPDSEQFVSPSSPKKTKERKERGKEEILLLSRIRRCKEESKIRAIDISRLNLDRLPGILTQIFDLKELTCRKNPLQSLEEFKVFRFLEKLDLSFTVNLTSLPGWPAIFEEFPGLKVLELNNIQLAEIPLEIKALKRLEKLSVRNNRLQSLPDWLIEFRYLHTFDFSNNQIEILPACIGHMKALTDINAQNNPCQSLDQAIPEIAFLLNKRAIYLDKEERKSLTHRAVHVNQTVIEKQRNQLIHDFVAEI